MLSSGASSLFDPLPYRDLELGRLISHSRAYASRADFIYMAPPFIAYFGALQNDSGGLALMQIAYDQIRLYRSALFDSNVSLWRHIAMGSSPDAGHWGTGTLAFVFLMN